jgi:hypothetical protein
LLRKPNRFNYSRNEKIGLQCGKGLFLPAKAGVTKKISRRGKSPQHILGVLCVKKAHAKGYERRASQKKLVHTKRIMLVRVSALEGNEKRKKQY